MFPDEVCCKHAVATARLSSQLILLGARSPRVTSIIVEKSRFGDCAPNVIDAVRSSKKWT
jgi:hypothetical protein